MLPGAWTAELGRQRIAELHRQAEHQRLVRLARAQRRGGTTGMGRRRRWRWLAAWRRGSGAGATVEPSTAPSHSATAGDAMSSS
jgi:hypothetical protein